MQKTFEQLNYNFDAFGAGTAAASPPLFLIRTLIYFLNMNRTLTVHRHAGKPLTTSLDMQTLKNIHDFSFNNENSPIDLNRTESDWRMY